MKVNSAGLTDVGRKRNHNEDSYLVDEELELYGVDVGIGGHEVGCWASLNAVGVDDCEVRE